MPTFVHPQYRAALLDAITGRSTTISSNFSPYSIQIWSGSQPGDCAVAATGTAAFTTGSYVYGFFLSMGAASNGTSQTTVLPRPNNTGIANSITAGYARIATNAYVGSTNCVIETTVGLAGSGAGVILDSLTFTSGGTRNVLAYSVKLPTSMGGTLMLGQATVNRLLDATHQISGSTATPQLLTSSTITFYDGTPPATADAPLSGNNVLGTLTCPATSPWNAASTSTGTTALSATQTITVTGTGTPTFWRVSKSGFTMQGSVGTANADFIVDSVSWTNGVNRTLLTAGLSVL